MVMNSFFLVEYVYSFLPSHQNAGDSVIYILLALI